MKRSIRSAATQLLLPASLQAPRQLSIAFETPATAGLSAEHRTAAVQALATVLLHAAGVQLKEDDDEQQ